MYSKIKSNLIKHACCLDPAPELKRRVGQEMKKICEGAHIRFSACCCNDLIDAGITPAECISPDFFMSLYKDFPVNIRKAPTRKGCGCSFCQDIGYYDTCPHGCIYCYANSRQNLVAKRYGRHNSKSSTLV